ncbi:50S ribosomal protein L23 [Candidatus Wolfebacteria bacterium]|nr:50S ribosomal protein L23 [Candidatus Wolfebacteria bacterium]
MSILNKFKKEEKQTGEKKVKTTVSIGTFSQPALLVKQAWISERAGDLSVLGKYIFIVEKKANKPEIKKAIESIYKVNVVGVNIVNVKGKTKRLGKSLGKTSAYKKAIITLKNGQKIDTMPH